MGGALTDAVWIFFIVIALIVLAAAALATRRYLLERSGGTVECGLRLTPGSNGNVMVSANWRLGVLSYQHDELCWYGALGVLLRPEQVFQRRALSVVSRRPADPAETAALGDDRIVVEVSTRPRGDASASANAGAGAGPGGDAGADPSVADPSVADAGGPEADAADAEASGPDADAAPDTDTPDTDTDAPDTDAPEADTPEASVDRVELAMTEEALTGFLAWLEASPPGSHLADIA